METSPKRKAKCSVLQRDRNVEENQEMGFDSGVGVGAVAVGNLEMVDSLCVKGSVPGSIFGSFTGKVENFGEPLLGADTKQVGFGVSSPKDGQETMETSPKKKFKRSVLHPDCNVAQNQEVGFESAAFSDVISRSSVGKVENFSEAFHEADTKRMGFGVSSPREMEEIVDISSKMKFKCSVRQPGRNVEENQAISFDSDAGVGLISEGNQEMVGSLYEKTPLPDSFSGSSAGVVVSFGEPLVGADAKRMDFVTIAQKEDLLSGSAEKRKLVVSEFQESANEGNLGLSGKCIYDNLSTSLDFGDAKGTVNEKDVEDDNFLEVEKKRILAELEAGTIFGGKTDIKKVTGFANSSKIDEKGSDFQEMNREGKIDGEKILATKGNDASVNRSLKIEVIDDTALIETMPVLKTGNGCVKVVGIAGSAKNTEKNGKQAAHGKKAKQARGKPKYVKNVLGASEGHMNPSRFLQVDNGVWKNGNPTKKMYSREEMEALRFVDIVEQRKLWSNIHTGLGAAVMREYHDLTSSKHQKSIHLNFGLSQRFERMKEPSAMIREEYFGNMDGAMENMEVCETESIDPSDDACTLDYGDEDSLVAVEGECSEDDDSDEDYNSILKPAFLVEGKPDFDSGPPHDGLEYLRRVRWEAAQIPNVKVAKLEKNKIKEEQSIYMPQIPEIASCPEHLLPLKQWEVAFLADFSELCRALSCYLDPTTKTSGKLQQVFLENVIVEKFNNLRTEEVRMSVGDGSVDYPTLSGIQKMDSVARVSMLRKRISLFESMTTLSRSDCLWLFALCAAIDTPLDADTCASLRGLLRKCASLRAGKSEVDDEVVMLNILATISGRFFGQSER
ncbi:hypothetical protein SLE2022_143650 [Rubroshorea leprosula]